MNRKDRRRAASKAPKVRAGDVITTSGVTASCSCGCGRVSHFWFVLPDGMTREQAVETQELHGPFSTEAAALADQHVVLFGKDCKMEFSGMWDPAWDRMQ